MATSHHGDEVNRGWPWGLKLVVIVLIAFVVLIGGLQIFGRAATARWLRYAATLREGGTPLTLEEIEKLRTQIPDEQNSALLFEEILPEFDNFQLARNDGPVFVLDSGSTDADFFTGIPRQSIEPSRAYLEKTRPLLDRLYALRDVPAGQLKVNIQSAPNLISILLPNMAPLRHAAKLARVDGMVCLTQDDLQGAVESARVQFALGGTLNEHPVVIGRLVQMAILALGTRTIEDTLRVGMPDDAQLMELFELLDARLQVDTMKWALLGERAFFVGTCDELVDGEQSLQQLSGNMGRGSAIPFLPDWLIRENQMRGAEILTWLVDAADDSVELNKAAKRIDNEVPKLPATQVIVRMMIPSLSRAVVLNTRLTAAMRSAHAGVAAERYRLATGEMITSLDQLVPEYLAAVPVDPFSGGSLKIVTTENGIVIYSVGDNLEDDGGSVVRREQRPRNFPDVGFRLHAPQHRGLLLIDLPPDEED